MKFTKLRLVGFKSFVEPTEFMIEKGLTGVVGPNGCGKSNLVEALRWVMGESSYKNMRASSMDDVIFSGSGTRPARNTAEVSLFLDNDDKTAPPAFNDAEELQVARRIERENGSNYRINGKEVRAKDVHLLFADASTGARSPSMIGQGRIGELISAKPQSRRALLEEAAGISGLHSRRHEAELRLRAAENNLERLEDVITQFDSQLESLKRQARQANRYRNIAGDIRTSEATLYYLRWSAAKEALANAQNALSEATKAIGERAEAQTLAAKEQAIVAHKMPQLREDEAKAAAALQRITIARSQLDDEQARIMNRKSELERRIEQLQNDFAREQKMLDENGDTLKLLSQEAETLNAQQENSAATEALAKSNLDEANEKLSASETQLNDINKELAELSAQKQRFEQAVHEYSNRRERLERQLSETTQSLAAIEGEITALAEPKARQEDVERAENLLKAAEAKALEAEKRSQEALEKEQQGRAPLQDAKARLNKVETEAATLARMLNLSEQELFPAIVESLKVEKGYEAALGAALGEDLDVSTDVTASVHWGEVEKGAEDPQFDGAIKTLDQVVKAPKQLVRRLAQIALVENAEMGEALQKGLKVGQRLVSRDGGLWRWDGYKAAADAPTPAAQRLAQKNRLIELDAEVVEATKAVRAEEQAYNGLRLGVNEAAEGERNAREAWRSAQKQLSDARDELAKAERSVSELSNRRSAQQEAQQRLRSDLEEAAANLNEAEKAKASVPDLSKLEEELRKAQAMVAEDRANLAESRAAFQGLARDAEMRVQRLSSIERETANWTERAKNAKEQMQSLENRLKEAEAEFAKISDAPSQLDEKRKSLLDQQVKAEEVRKAAADLLAEAENALSAADHLAKHAIVQLSEAKEARGRAEERLNAGQERCHEIEKRIRDGLECEPYETLKLANLDEGKPLPDADHIERRLEKQKAERERLGAVNLRADTESEEISEQRDALANERDDLIEAIGKLRSGIQSLNREGRERLLVAFDEVNQKFQNLFSHLFGGGTAELQLIESDDPLDAGLEILAHPPGKKPQTMTLLSGGEQALTAMALIFAVFLTNPAPICVLDEVDAPLDDHNVERFCDLMDQMAASTDTRFVIITHNPITMARMNRMFGVTMAERGVSQLVSVDLQTAEKMVEAV